MRKVVFTVAVVLAVALPGAAAALPTWFAPWAHWRLGGAVSVRPHRAPQAIPSWAWRRVIAIKRHSTHPSTPAGTTTTTATTTTDTTTTETPAPTPTTTTTPVAAPPAPAPAPPTTTVAAPPAPAPTPVATTTATTPPPPTTTTPGSSGGSGLTATEQALANAINAARAANGLPALSIDPSLESAARDHTQDLLANGAFTHDFIKNGTSYPFATWIGWYFQGACAGENIAEGQPTLGTDQAVQMWLNSPPHRENLLSASYTRMGVALDTSNGTAIATNDFGC